MTIRHSFGALLVIIGGSLLAWIAYRMVVPGVLVIVTNHGPAPLRDVVVSVTGASYAIGDLPAAESRAIGVRPTGESSVEIEFTDVQGSRVRLNAGGYFEPGYRGTIHIDLKDGQIEGVEGQPEPSVL